MEIEIKKEKTEHLGRGGVPFLELSLALPYATGEGKDAARVNRFFARVQQGVRTLAESLVPVAEEQYEQNEDPRRRFTHRPYRMAVTSTVTTEPWGIRAERRLVLTHRGRTLYERVWCEGIRGGRVFPLRKRERKKPKGR